MTQTKFASVAEVVTQMAQSTVPVRFRMRGQNTVVALRQRGYVVFTAQNDRTGKDHYVFPFGTKAENAETPKRMVRNLMNPGAPLVEIAEDTPASCDPSRESYWSA
jgi:hypothetical protein